jgi:hypothetical protein
VREEPNPNHTTARKPVPLLIIQYSLLWPNSALVKTSNKFIRVELNKYSARLKGQPSIVINIFVAVGPANNLASKCCLFTTSLYRRRVEFLCLRWLFIRPPESL